jgi:hypothetical protein
MTRERQDLAPAARAIDQRMARLTRAPPALSRQEDHQRCATLTGKRRRSSAPGSLRRRQEPGPRPCTLQVRHGREGCHHARRSHEGRSGPCTLGHRRHRDVLAAVSVLGLECVIRAWRTIPGVLCARIRQRETESLAVEVMEPRLREARDDCDGNQQRRQPTQDSPSRRAVRLPGARQTDQGLTLGYHPGLGRAMKDAEAEETP